MYIISLYINRNRIRLSSENNLIYSKVNSTGKTTLIRLILYSMGFSIPSTKGLNFSTLSLLINIRTSKGRVSLFRHNNNIRLIKNGSLIIQGPISDNYYDIESTIFNINDIYLINNLLGVFYFDQEKGWTLLNRGRVIGGNEFHIQTFINSFISNTLEGYREDIKDINKQNIFYRHLMYLVKLKSNIHVKFSQNRNVLNNINKKLNVISLYINSLEKQIEELKRIRASNTKFVSMLNNLGLSVYKIINGHKITIPINRNTLNNFQLNADIINIRIRSMKYHLCKYKQQQHRLKKILNNHGLINLKNSVQILKQDISNMNMPVYTIQSIIKANKKKRNKLRNQVNTILNNSNIVNELFYLIRMYAKELGVDDKIEITTNFIFTKKLKKYSGAILHLIVFAFRLACLKLLERHFHIIPPIILDSPLNGELDISNAKKMFKLLRKHFNRNQLIVASTNKLNFVGWNNVIHMKHGALSIRN